MKKTLCMQGNLYNVYLSGEQKEFLTCLLLEKNALENSMVDFPESRQNRLSLE